MRIAELDLFHPYNHRSSDCDEPSDLNDRNLSTRYQVMSLPTTLQQLGVLGHVLESETSKVGTVFRRSKCMRRARRIHLRTMLSAGACVPIVTGPLRLGSASTVAASAPTPGTINVAGVNKPAMKRDSIKINANIVQFTQSGFVSKKERIESNIGR